MELLKKAAEKSIPAEKPQFKIGDTVDVSVRIIEGQKERIQVFNGTVIARKGSGNTETFIVRRIVNSEGVERIFPVCSPRIAGVSVVRSAHVRRAKLFFLRDRIGKAVNLREKKRIVKKKK
jgi:large subunit ribosomal protein L19